VRVWNGFDCIHHNTDFNILNIYSMFNYTQIQKINEEILLNISVSKSVQLI
jgi:hypothetical protein